MSEAPAPVTRATEAAETLGVPHRVVAFGHATSAADAAAKQGLPLGALLRTIVVRRGADDYLFVLVPGGRRFDWPKLRALLGVTRMSLPDKDEARDVTGYERGTITPFGSTTAWPVIADASFVHEPIVSIGGGAFGVALQVAPADLVATLAATVADVSIPDEAEAG